MVGWFKRGVAAGAGLCMAVVGLIGAGPSAAALAPTSVPRVAEAPDFLAGPIAVLADVGVVVGRNTTIAGGATVVCAADAGTYLSSTRAVVAVDRDAHLDAVAGDTVQLGRDTTVTDLATNSAVPGGVVTGQTTGLSVPVDVAFPTPAPVTPGTTAITVPRDTTRDLAPGVYGTLTIARNTTVRLTDGDYVFASMTIDRDTTIVTGQHTTITVTGTASVARNVRLGDADAPSTALRLTVLGADTTGTAALAVDRDTLVGAALVVPNGTTSIARNTRLVGSLAARWVTIDRDAQITYRAGGSPVTPLVASIVEPLDGSTVSGEVQLRAEETTGAQVAQITYSVDGTVVGTSVTAPFVVTWDSATGPGDDIDVTATVTGTDGRSVTTDPIALRVAPAGTTDEARMQADVDNGVLTPEDFTRYAVYRWLSPVEVPVGYEVPAQYQVPAEVFADDGLLESTSEMIWATRLLDSIDPAVRAEVLIHLGVDDPNEVHETLSPAQFEGLVAPVLDDAHLHTDALPAITTTGAADASASGTPAAGVGGGGFGAGVAAAPTSSNLASLAQAASQDEWHFGELECDDNWDVANVTWYNLTSHEECTYTTLLATFSFNIHDPRLGVDATDERDWYLRTGSESGDFGVGGPNGVPDVVDALAIGYWQAAWTYSQVLGFDAPAHVQVDLDRDPETGVAYSWPQGHVHLKASDGVYLMRHELFHQYEYATSPGIWLTIGAETAAQSVAGGSPVWNNSWWAEASAEWAAHRAAAWAEERAANDPYAKPPRTQAYVSQRYTYAYSIWKHLRATTQALTTANRGAQPQYGAFLFAEYLDEQVGTESILQTWQTIDPGVLGVGAVGAIEAITSVVEAHGADLADILKGYHAANYSITNPTDNDLGYRDEDRLAWAENLDGPPVGLPGRTTTDADVMASDDWEGRRSVDAESLVGGDTWGGRVRIEQGGVLYLEVNGSSTGDGQVATIRLNRPYDESGQPAEETTAVQVRHVASYDPVPGTLATAATECRGWTWAEPIEPAADGSFTIEVALSPSCPHAVVVVSSTDPDALLPTLVDYAVTAREPGTGTVRAWGNNWNGQLGPNTTDEWATAAVQVGITDAVQVAAGVFSGYALRADGTVWAWGANGYGQLGDGTTTSSSVPVQVVGLDGVTAIASEGYSAYALRVDGTVWAWGSDYGYQLGVYPRPAYWSSVPLQVQGLTGVTAIEASTLSVMVVREDGTVVGWGNNNSGTLAGACGGSTCVQPTVITALTGVAQVALGSNGGYALRTDGTVVSWGSQTYGRRGDGSAVGSQAPTLVTGLTDVTAVAAGQNNGYALRSDGTLWAWGRSINLGTGAASDATVPVAVEALADVTAVSTSTEVVVALLDDGTVWVWGNGSAGQFGLGLSPASYVPAPVQGLTGATAIAAGYLTQYALSNATAAP